MSRVVIDTHPRLDSVGLVCPCGKAVTSMEGAIVRCGGCGRIYSISVMEIRGPGPAVPRRVEQSILAPPGGNCFAACVASILDLPLHDVPNYHGADWWDEWVSWAETRGYSLTWYEPASARPEGTTWWIAGPISPRHPGKLHAVVMHGDQLVWDPHPERTPDLDPWTTEDAVVIEKIPRSTS